MSAGCGTALRDRLPPVRGRYETDVALSALTWFRVGGPVDVLFRPADREDLIGFLADCPGDVPITLIGVGSNLLIRDGGVRGVAIRLGRGFSRVKVEGARVHAGAGAADVNVALTAAEASVTGLEFLRGIPGTVGGALRMNGGAYGHEIKDVLVSAEAVDRKGRLHSRDAESLGLAYRHCAAPEDWIFVGAILQGAPGDPAEIRRRLAAVSETREETQPVRTRTGGSTFKNPPDGKAWELIDRAGCRGLRRGAAMVSDKHCNFLINLGGASATDLEELGEEVRRRVRENAGVELEWEIRRLGEAAVEVTP